jgi:RNA polymerase sigma factor (sigma-70 family)
MEISGEEELVKGCVKGNRRYQELLYLKFCRKMMGVCYRYSRSKEESEDLLQEAFIRVFSRLHQFRHEGSLEGWIRKVVLSTIYDNFRKKSFLIVLSDFDSYEETPVTNDFMEEVDFEELVNAIKELSPGYRTVFNMYAVEGYTHKEIGTILGISPGTSKSQYSNARRILQNKLKIYSPGASVKIK